MKVTRRLATLLLPLLSTLCDANHVRRLQKPQTYTDGGNMRNDTLTNFVTMTYPLPEFYLRMNIIDENGGDGNLDEFQDALDFECKLHLHEWLLDQDYLGEQVLPVGAFHQVDLSGRLLRTYIGTGGSINNNQDSSISMAPRSLVQVGYTGFASFVFDTRNVDVVYDSTNSTEALHELTLLVVKSFQSSSYFLQFLKRLEIDRALQVITSLQVSVLDQVVVDDSQVNFMLGGMGLGSNYKNGNNRQQPSVSNRSPFANAAVALMTILLVSTFGLVYYYRRFWSTQQAFIEQAKDIQRNNSNDSGGTMVIAPPANVDLQDENSQVMLDEWTEKLTSIPLRDSVKKNKKRRAQSDADTVPVANNHHWLGCITEEGSEDASSVRSMYSVASSSNNSSVYTSNNNKKNKALDALGGSDNEDDLDLDNDYLLEIPQSLEFSKKRTEEHEQQQQHQFDDADFASPSDYEAKFKKNNVGLI